MIKSENTNYDFKQICLDPKVGLGRQDKIKYFDELRTKYLDMMKTYSSVEKKCGDLENQIRVVETGKTQTFNSKRNKPKSLPGFDASSGSYEQIKDDPSLPEGWKCAWRVMTGFSGGTKVKNFWAPDRRHFASRVSALNYMVTELRSSKEDIMQLRSGLFNEEWEEHPNLPDGWLCQKDRSKSDTIKESKKFMTENFLQFRGNMPALKELVIHSTNEVIANFLTGFSPDSEVVKWLHCRILPFPWRLAQIKGPRILLISPDGQLYITWGSAKKALRRDGRLSENQLEDILLFLKPLSGFRVGKGESEEDPKDLMKPVKETDEPKVEASLGWEPDLSCPPGWSSQLGHITGKLYKDADGRTYFGRLDALRHLMKQARFEEIIIMSKNLEEEGWKTVDNLPEGWMMRLRLKDGKEQTSYLTSNFDTANSVGAMIAILKKNPDKYSEEILDTFKSQNGLKWLKEDDLPTGWTCTTVEGVMEKLIKFMSSDGKFLNSAPQAIQYLYQTQAPSTQIEKMKRYLYKSGWSTSEHLPLGWFEKRKSTRKKKNGFNFLTPKFEQLRSFRLMINHFEQAGYKERVINDIKDKYNQRKITEEKRALNKPNVKREIKNEPDDVSKYHTDENLPAGWKVFNFQHPGNRNRNYIIKNQHFLSPGKQVFSSIANVLKYLLNCGGFSEEIDIFKKYLLTQGWLSTEFLPPGYFVKQKMSERGFISISPSFEHIKTLQNLVTNLRENGFGEEAVTRWEDNYRSLSKEPTVKKSTAYLDRKKALQFNTEVKKENEDPLDELVNFEDTESLKRKADDAVANRSKKVKVKQEIEPEEPSSSPQKDFSLPSGWKQDPSLPLGWRQDSGSLLCPQGRRFTSRVAAVAWMIRNQTSPEQIYTMWCGLHNEGWELATNQTSLLPAGWRLQWMVGVRDWQYLDRECRLLRSTEQARGALVEGKDEQGELKRFDTWAREVEKSQERIVWVEEPASLPKGWRVSRGLEQEILKDHHRARFPSRKEAIDHLIQEQYSPSDIFRLWSTLEQEGWREEGGLPTGWKRKWYGGEGRHHYLSPMMEVVRGARELLEVVKKGGEYSAEEREKVGAMVEGEEALEM